MNGPATVNSVSYATQGGLFNVTFIPAARSSAAVLIDSDVMILFGGVRGGEGYSYSDVWFFSLANYTWMWHGGPLEPNMAETANRPSSRAAAAWFKEGDSFYIFGGYSAWIFTALNDIWSYNISNSLFTRRHSGINIAPKRRVSGAHFYDKQTKSLFIFGGHSSELFPKTFANDTWRYDLTANVWTDLTSSIAPPGRAFPVFFYDEGRKMFHVHGGHTIMTDAAWLINFYDTDVWRFNVSSSQWTRIPSKTSMPVRAGAVSFYDFASDKAYLYGGEGNNEVIFGLPRLDDALWEYDLVNATWSAVKGLPNQGVLPIFGTKGVEAASNVPPSRFQIHTAYDELNRQAIFFGGYSCDLTSSCNPVPSLADTWRLTYTLNAGSPSALFA